MMDEGRKGSDWSWLIIGADGGINAEEVAGGLADTKFTGLTLPTELLKIT
uniref:Uncharacterized protein n=1 Tax=Pithovirus LCPAC201 TaxID=2506591 RepID=A0A481Z5L6_9VIRU|nr:MAG: hypothetical protein LCPAC201_00230 [Pithovirus LCPAC201]